MSCTSQPLMLSYGMGLDSTALLVWLLHQRIRPDAILFADTGSEWPETYDYLDIIQAWCRRVGFPSVITVRYGSPFYGTLEENCLANKTLPSLAYGRKGCSLKWKVQAMNAWTERWPCAQRAWTTGMKVLKLIGYDASPADQRRSQISEDSRYSYVYPLRESGIDRAAGARLIADAGLPIPRKSACFFCPATKVAEIVELAQRHPHLAARALRLEALASHGTGSTRGLARSTSWRELLRERAPDLLAALENGYDTGLAALADYARGVGPWPDGVTPRERLRRYRAARQQAA